MFQKSTWSHLVKEERLVTDNIKALASQPLPIRAVPFFLVLIDRDRKRE
jgi:hypothetical protein